MFNNVHGYFQGLRILKWHHVISWNGWIFYNRLVASGREILNGHVLNLQPWHHWVKPSTVRWAQRILIDLQKDSPILRSLYGYFGCWWMLHLVHIDSWTMDYHGEFPRQCPAALPHCRSLQAMHAETWDNPEGTGILGRTPRSMPISGFRNP